MPWSIFASVCYASCGQSVARAEIPLPYFATLGVARLPHPETSDQSRNTPTPHAGGKLRALHRAGLHARWALWMPVSNHVTAHRSVYYIPLTSSRRAKGPRDDRAGQIDRAEAWRPRIAAGVRPALAWPQGLTDFARRVSQRVREWAAAEAAPGRLVPWLAIAFGCGTILYFAGEREPALWAIALLVTATVSAAILCRHRPLAFSATVGLTALSAGFAAATVKREIIAHPVLSAPAWNVELAGFVEMREERERSDRIVVRLERIVGSRIGEKLERVRVSVRKGTAPPVGSFIEFKARLSPPLEPLRPGGYDFARDMYFQRLGASGFVLGAIRTVEAPHAAGLRLRYAAFIEGMREAIDKRIRTTLPGDKGAIASALITGKRDAISTPVNEAMYVSGLAHVLSISG